MPSTAIVWFRQDLRIADNPALESAIAGHDYVIPLYILDDNTPDPWPMGGAGRWWLDRSLTALDQDLKHQGSSLILRRGDPKTILSDLCAQFESPHVYWNRCYEPYAIKRDQDLKSYLKNNGIGTVSFNGSLLFEPFEIKNQKGDFFKVFTPFWKTCRAAMPEFAPCVPWDLKPLPPEGVPTADLKDWHLYSGTAPSTPHWASEFTDFWTPGERGAQAQLMDFLPHVAAYKDARNVPSLTGTSSLSPHLHFGEISPRQIVQTLSSRVEPGTGVDVFLSEIGWREFSYHLLYHVQTLPTEPFRPEFAHFPWQKNDALLDLWQRGQTGYPIVDAGMRQLWRTGWMHNRVRMIVASFLTKHLLIPWQQGARWFWDTLVDADLASNSASWQWVSGCGADAAPYFRIFNPILQGKTFDPDGAYVRRWVPELKDIPSSHIHEPWSAPPTILRLAGVQLGKTYPAPCVDHGGARDRALGAYGSLKAKHNPTD